MHGSLKTIWSDSVFSS